jgi:hypothetical protein
MKPRVLLFTLLISATGLLFFVAWQIMHTAFMPAAAETAAEAGERLPAHRDLAVDLIHLRGVWLAWALAAILGVWFLEKQGRATFRARLALFALYLVPLLSTTLMLLARR